MSETRADRRAARSLAGIAAPLPMCTRRPPRQRHMIRLAHAANAIANLHHTTHMAAWAVPHSFVGLAPAPQPGPRIVVRTPRAIEPPPFIESFHSFANLPLELEILIWEQCAVIPRCIQFRINRGAQCDALGWCKDDWQMFLTYGRMDPAMLTVSKVAREVGLKHYKLAFYSSLIDGPTYFNFAVDSMYFPTSADIQRLIYVFDHTCICPAVPKPLTLELELFFKLKHLVIGAWTPALFEQGYFPTMILQNFTGLKTFTCGGQSSSIFEAESPVITCGLNWQNMVNRPEVGFLCEGDMEILAAAPRIDGKDIEKKVCEDAHFSVP
ncbi:hypothetical protein VTL71DRAFT_8801 [Oculimacula yallundae]|uniref:2EXR domain-containing protein n=1 Tax=Oculimacula yallundae TaxID=86028 RepID=A0ABR4CZT5_9HELO